MVVVGSFFEERMAGLDLTTAESHLGDWLAADQKRMLYHFVNHLSTHDKFSYKNTVYKSHHFLTLKSKRITAITGKDQDEYHCHKN